MLRRAISIENFENDVYLISFGFLDFLCAILFFFLVCYPYSLSKSVYSYDVKVLRQSQKLWPAKPKKQPYKSDDT